MAIPTRKATVEHLSENRLRLTCKDCGHAWTKRLSFLDGRPWRTDAVAWHVRYWNQNGGISAAKCAQCAKRRAR